MPCVIFAESFVLDSFVDVLLKNLRECLNLYSVGAFYVAFCPLWRLVELYTLHPERQAVHSEGLDHYALEFHVEIAEVSGSVGFLCYDELGSFRVESVDVVAEEVIDFIGSAQARQWEGYNYECK